MDSNSPKVLTDLPFDFLMQKENVRNILSSILIRVARLEMRCSANNEELTLWKDDTKTIEDQLSGENGRLAQVNAQLQSRMTDLEQRMDQTQSVMIGETNQQTNEILIAKTSDLEKQLREKTQIAENLFKRLNEMKTSIDLLNNEVNANKEELSKVTAFNATKQNLLMLQNELDKKRNKEIEKKLEEAKTIQEDLRSELDKNKEANLLLKAEKEKMLKDQNKLEQKLDEAKISQDKLIREKCQLTQEKAKLESKLADLEKHSKKKINEKETTKIFENEEMKPEKSELTKKLKNQPVDATKSADDLVPSKPSFDFSIPTSCGHLLSDSNLKPSFNFGSPTNCDKLFSDSVESKLLFNFSTPTKCDNLFSDLVQQVSSNEPTSF